MIGHLLRLAWNRRRTAFLLWLEMLVSFLVLAALGVGAASHLAEVHRPRGFDDRDVWAVTAEPEDGAHWGRWTVADSVAAQQAYRVLQAQEGTVAVAEVTALPYTGMSMNVVQRDGRTFDYYLTQVGDDFPRALSVPLAAGRWFGPEDDGLDSEPVVLNQSLATALFGTEDPLGRTFALDRDGRQGLVVGLVREFRPFLFAERPGRFAICRVRLDRAIPKEWPGLPMSYLIRVKPSTAVTFARDIEEGLATAAPTWRVRLAAPLAQMRQQELRFFLRPLVVFGVISTFLLLMVCLGLVGVLWQSVTQRTREIGIRRAAGASRQGICLQVVGEAVVLTTLAVGLGVILVLHSAVLDLFPQIEPGTYLAGLLSAAAVLYLLVAAASLYPGWLATRVHPAEALHYE
ncbi:MAG: FtsX-like permease family protein [Candidatus Latescibacterota bacterium]|jgi:putative ABC transport system permease protein